MIFGVHAAIFAIVPGTFHLAAPVARIRVLRDEGGLKLKRRGCEWQAVL
jgi:hypothetical protein